MKNIIPGLLLLIAACTASRNIIPSTPGNISNGINNSEWIFTPDRIMPQAGRTRQLSGSFSVKYVHDSLFVYLPYYGTAYGGADVLSGRGPLDFISTNVQVEKQQPKAGEWNITVTPKDKSSVQYMYFNFFDNGHATLNITMTNRSAVSYNGSISPAQ